MSTPPCPFTVEQLRAWADPDCGAETLATSRTLDALTEVVCDDDHCTRSDLLALWLADAMEREEKLRKRNSKWRSAFEGARDSILYERGPLEGESAGSDFINAVLGILDDEFSEVVPPLNKEPKP